MGDGRQDHLRHDRKKYIFRLNLISKQLRINTIINKTERVFGLFLKKKILTALNEIFEKHSISLTQRSFYEN